MIPRLSLIGWLVAGQQGFDHIISYQPADDDRVTVFLKFRLLYNTRNLQHASWGAMRCSHEDQGRESRLKWPRPPPVNHQLRVALLTRSLSTSTPSLYILKFRLTLTTDHFMEATRLVRFSLVLDSQLQL